MGELIRLLLADDHILVRQGTAALLRREPDLQVIGEASDGAEAVRLTQELEPDIVVMDVRMPVLNGIAATRCIRDKLPQVQILVLTAHDDDEYIVSLLQAGASGYLLKSAPIGELVRAIRQVRAGESPLDPSIARKVVLRMSGRRQAKDRTDPELQDLTARELEVLQLLAQGLGNTSIGQALYISDRTVQAHLTNIFSKLHVSSRLEAVLLAIRRGWLTLEP